jgi:thioredoxin 1
MAPHLAAVSSEYAGRVDVWKINADEQPGVVRELGIMGIPTLIVYRNGREVTRYVGGMGAAGMRALFAAALADEAEPSQALPRVQGTERGLRLGVAAVLLVLAAFTGWPLVLLLAAAAVFFSAIHDRCPLWQGIKTRLGW